MGKRQIKRLEPEKRRFKIPAWESSDEELRKKWVTEQEEWKKLGLDPAEVLSILKQSTPYRVMFQDSLAAREEIHKIKREVTKELAVIKKGEDLLDLAIRQPQIFGEVACEFARKVKLYRQGLEEFLKRPRGPAGAPGERWLRLVTVELMNLFRAHGLTWEKAEALVERALGFAGHLHAVSEDKIHYIVKKERARDPQFGARPKTGSAPLPVATPSESPAPGPETGHTPPPLADEATPSESLPASPSPLPPDAS